MGRQGDASSAAECKLTRARRRTSSGTALEHSCDQVIARGKPRPEDFDYSFPRLSVLYSLGAGTSSLLRTGTAMTSQAPTGTIQDRVQAVERLTELFRPERFVYLAFAVTAFVLLVVCVIASLVQGGNASSMLPAFASTGVVTFTSARAIVMWNKALAVVAPNGKSSDD